MLKDNGRGVATDEVHLSKSQSKLKQWCIEGNVKSIDSRPPGGSPHPQHEDFDGFPLHKQCALGLCAKGFRSSARWSLEAVS